MFYSIDFDKDQEFFAVGGVTRQLKVYEYHSVITRPVSVHYPVQDLTCASKIRWAYACVHTHPRTHTMAAEYSTGLHGNIKGSTTIQDVYKYACAISNSWYLRNLHYLILTSYTHA